MHESYFIVIDNRLNVMLPHSVSMSTDIHSRHQKCIISFLNGLSQKDGCVPESEENFYSKDKYQYQNLNLLLRIFTTCAVLVKTDISQFWQSPFQKTNPTCDNQMSTQLYNDCMMYACTRRVECASLLLVGATSGSATPSHQPAPLTNYLLLTM